MGLNLDMSMEDVSKATAQYLEILGQQAGNINLLDCVFISKCDR